MLIIVFSIWAFYPSDRTNSESLPVIYAEKSPIRVKPEPENITITADYNSSIYQTFGSANNPKKIENLLKPQDLTEQPMPRGELFAGLNSDIVQDTSKSKIISTPNAEDNNSLDNEEKISSSAPSQNELTEPDTQNLDRSQTVSSQEKIAVDIPISPPRAIPGIFDNTPTLSSTANKEDNTKNIENTEPAAGAATIVLKAIAPIAEKPSSATSSGNYYVQLASIQDKTRINESWKKLTDKHSGLKTVDYRSEIATISGKGTFYRIQAGPLSKEVANKLCNQINAQAGSCFVTTK